MLSLIELLYFYPNTTEHYAIRAQNGFAPADPADFVHYVNIQIAFEALAKGDSNPVVNVKEVLTCR